MKKSRIIALLTAVVMIMSVVPAMASTRAVAGGYFVDAEGDVYEKSGANLIANPSFEDGLSGLTDNSEYYEVSADTAHDGTKSLKAIKSTKGEGAITAYFAVEDANASYYLSFWYKNVDTVARRPRVTFAFTDSSKTIPTEEDDFTDATNAWIQAGTATNDQDMEYSKGEWVQYTTVLKGNGNADACKFVALNIYGLTKNVAYIDEFELYELIPSAEYGDAFSKAIAEWEAKVMPVGKLEGFGTLNLPREVNADGVKVEWMSSSVAIDAQTGEYSAQAEEELVILTARLYAENNAEVYYDFEYPYIVKSMFTPYVEWMKSEVFPKIGASIDGNVSLVKSHKIEGYYPATITWECSDPAVLDGDGNFTAPETTKGVDLVATIECNGATTDVVKRVKAIGGNIVNEGLVMYYDFEKALGSGGVLYDNSQKARVYNATAEGIKLVDGYAKFEGGDSAIILASDYGTALPGSYTVSMWVNVDKSIATNTGMYRFFDFGGDTMTSQFLRYIPGNGEFAFMDRSTAPDKDTFEIMINSNEAFAQTWKLITLVYDFSSSPAKATLYIDGKAVASSTSNTLKNSVSSLAGSFSTAGFIGRTQWQNGDNPDFIGLMDEVRIYDRAITADEITTLYNETRPTVTAPITVKFQDVDGNTLKDDMIIAADVETIYDLPANYKNIPSDSSGQYKIVYTYIPSKSTDSIFVSADDDNVCILVFEVEQKSKGGNIITNPSFENGTEGWTTSNYANPVVDGKFGMSIVKDGTKGSYALKLTSAQGSASDGALSTKWDVEPNAEYRFTMDIKHAHAASDVTTGFLELLNAGGSSVGHIAGDNPGQVWSGSGEYVPTNADGSWTSVDYTFTTTADTVAVGLKLAWIGNEGLTIDNVTLKNTAYPDEEEEEEDDSNLHKINVKYVDTVGNELKEPVIVKVSKSVNLYEVADNLKVMDKVVNGDIATYYVYREDLSTASVSPSVLRDNVCTLVFDVVSINTKAELPESGNLVTDGGFKGEDGKFSWGTWVSPETGSKFDSNCQDWFYQVDRDTNAAALYTAGLTADDYAVGSRWNDGTKGLCSMANFIPVEKGKIYIVSYDYKHQTAGTDASYISTSFQRTRDYEAGATGQNIPQNVSTEWQKNTFVIHAPENGYIYFHFSWLGSGGSANTGNNSGNGPYWYFDNFKVIEADTFQNKITYSEGYAEIVAKDGTEGYLVQASYDNEGALTSVVISEKLTLSEENVTKVEVAKGSKLMLVKDLTSLEPLAPAIIAK